MRVSFLREPEVVYLGGRSAGIGPRGVRWGCFGIWGGYHVVPPLSYLAVMQLGGVLEERGLVDAVEPGLHVLPPSHIRPLLQILVPGAKPRHAALATDEQCLGVALAVSRANDWKRVHASWTDGRRSKAAPDDDAFDTVLYAVGKAFALWPYDVLDRPWVEVDAVIRAIGKENGHDEVSDEMAEFVKQKALALADERRTADERLRALGVIGG